MYAILYQDQPKKARPTRPTMNATVTFCIGYLHKTNVDHPHALIIKILILQMLLLDIMPHVSQSY